MPENPSYNSTHPKWRGTELADLDCGYAIKAVEASGPFRTGSVTLSATQVLGVGECVSLIRVRAGTEILGAELYWARTAAGTCVPTTVLGVGDPFCCGRLLGPVNTLFQRGASVPTGSPDLWGECATMQKLFSNVGDGCGIGYVYTCSTDIVMTNLYNDGNAFQGGAPGAYTVGSQQGAALSSGKFTLVLHVRQK